MQPSGCNNINLIIGETVMLKAETLKNLALTLGEEKVVNDSLSFKKYYIKVDAEQHDKWVSECKKLETAGVFQPTMKNEACPDTLMIWHGLADTKYVRLGVMIFSDEVVISYKTKSTFDKM